MKYRNHAEMVMPGHPDKVADAISDTVLDVCLNYDPRARVAVETLVKGPTIVFGGEITVANPERLRASDLTGPIIAAYKARTLPDRSLNVYSHISVQSLDISNKMGDGGAGDQCTVFGHAIREKNESGKVIETNYLPLSYYLAYKIVEAFGKLPYGPDGKIQVSMPINLAGRNSIANAKVCASLQDRSRAGNLAIQETIYRVFGETVRCSPVSVVVNPPDGSFVNGGPEFDCGVTGRKIISDSYGWGYVHGGGAFSGKDMTKMDRAGAYLARHVAKSLVANGCADKVSVALTYEMGCLDPVDVAIDAEVDGVSIYLYDAVVRNFDLSVKAATELSRLPEGLTYANSLNAGHFTNPDLPWERIELI